MAAVFPFTPPFVSLSINAAREGAWLTSGSTVRLIRSPSLMFEIGSADAAGEMMGISAGTRTWLVATSALGEL